MSVRLNGSTSGYTELDAPAVAGNNVLKLPANNGTNGYPIVTDGGGGLSFSQLTSGGLANNAVTADKLSAGMVLKVQSYSDVGSSTSSGTYTNANTALFSYTPVSTNSTLFLIASFQTASAAVAGVNTISYHAIGESGGVIGSGYICQAPSGSGGVGVQTMGSIQTVRDNTSLNARQFQMMHASNSGYAVSTTSIRLTILEVAN